MNSVKVVLMCGGIGKRMAPFTTDKSSLKFLGKSLILHQINSAREAGINHFVIITNQENNASIRSDLVNLNNVRIEFALQQKPLGMADALLSTADFIDDEPFILVSSNDIFDSSAYSMLLQEYAINNDKYAAYICAKSVNSYFPGGYLVVNANNIIDRIVEKPPPGQEPSNLINIVLHLHTKPAKLRDYLAATTSGADDIYEKSLDRMIDDGFKLKALAYGGPWQSIKHPWHILKAMEHFLDGITKYISPKCHISDKATIDGNVIIEDNVKVFEGAVIRGPSYIGKGTVIGNNALVRNSNIGEKCVVGFGTEIKNSYVSDGCWFHSNYIGDSVIEDNCSFGAGAVTANFRHDEANINLKIGGERIDTGTDKLGALIGKKCRIGIHSSLMPGVRIGANSFIGAHVYLIEDIESNRKVLAESHNRVMINDNSNTDNKRQELLKKLNERS